MKMNMSNKTILKFRRALKRLVALKFGYCIDKGDYDSIIENFLEGDTVEMTMKFNFLPNDIIFMRALAGRSTPSSIVSKVSSMWDEERRKS